MAQDPKNIDKSKLDDINYFKEWLTRLGLKNYVEYQTLQGFTITLFGVYTNDDKFEAQVLKPLKEELEKVKQVLPPAIDALFRSAYKTAHKATHPEAASGGANGGSNDKREVKIEIEEKESKKERRVNIHNAKDLSYRFTFIPSDNVNSTTITNAVRELHPSLKKLEFYSKNINRLHTDLDWNKYASNGADIYGRPPKYTNTVSKQVSLRAKKNDKCYVKTLKIFINPMSAPFLVGNYNSCFYCTLIFWFLSMIVLAIVRNDWISLAVDIVGIIVTIAIKCYSCLQKETGQNEDPKTKQYGLWQVYVLTCNADIDGPTLQKSNAQLCNDFFVEKGICFLPLFGFPLICMIVGVFYHFPFYVDLVVGLLSYGLYLFGYHCKCLRCRDRCQIKKMLSSHAESVFATIITKNNEIEIHY